MNAGFATDGLPEGAFVIIENGNVNDPDNAKLYVKGAAAYGFITDMSGSQGIKGETGAKGEQGSKGEQGVGISAVTIDGGTNVSDGISYTLTIQKTDNSSVPVTFIAPRGIKGENGADGMAASITIGTVNTGAAGSTAQVTNGGTATEAVLNFIIPRGDKGETGDKGATGATGPAGSDGKLQVYR